MPSITEIKRIRSLSYKKYRQLERRFIIEGHRLVASAMESGFNLEKIYFDHDFHDLPANRTVVNQIKKQPLEWELVDRRPMEKMAATKSPSGILAVAELPSMELARDDILPEGNWLYLDRLSDPGNLGTLIRTAAWFDIRNIGLSPGCANPWNPKVVRSGMGGHFAVNIFELELSRLKTAGLKLVGAHMSGQSVNENWDTPDRWILILGSEAHGLSSATRSLLDLNVAIPRLGSGESLNVAAAGAILLNRLTAG